VRSAPENRDAAAIEAARRRAITAWSIVDDALAGQQFLAGDFLSLAEITLGTHIYRWFNYPIERPALKNLHVWYDRCQARPGFQKHIVMPIT
jgi:glutathione S-transferase